MCTAYNFTDITFLIEIYTANEHNTELCIMKTNDTLKVLPSRKKNSLSVRNNIECRTHNLKSEFNLQLTRKGT